MSIPLIEARDVEQEPLRTKAKTLARAHAMVSGYYHRLASATSPLDVCTLTTNIERLRVRIAAIEAQ